MDLKVSSSAEEEEGEEEEEATRPTAVEVQSEGPEEQSTSSVVTGVVLNELVP